MKEKILKIQSELKAPKGQYNNFGKYKYRSCEDILEAVKPLLKENNLIMNITDELISVGERYYIKATAILTDVEKEEQFINVAYAREDETKKGMDGSQITGTASSYARKYALNGLFLIDDTKDADTDEYHNQNNKMITKAQIKKIGELVEDISAMLNYYNIDKIENMTSDLADQIIKRKSNGIKRENS